MIDEYAARKAALLAEQNAAAPRDMNAEIDLERERELNGLRQWRGYLTDEEKAEYQRIRERSNERARAALQARRAGEQKADREKMEARQRAELEAEQARVRPILRASFDGTDAEFEERWPQLWARHRDRKALDAAAAGYDAALAEKRRQLADLF